jgi:hypothetical protein
MLLAQRLLTKGETQTVLEYFALCAKFWKGGSSENLTSWTAKVKAGDSPDFGSNLKYGL